jgi:phosphoribosylcarboxyaminoimidazole (NCAIR) mutase
MPPGIPVATVSLGKGGAKNAAVLAAQILALKYPAIAERLKAYREKLTREVLEKSESLNL